LADTPHEKRFLGDITRFPYITRASEQAGAGANAQTPCAPPRQRAQQQGTTIIQRKPTAYPAIQPRGL